MTGLEWAQALSALGGATIGALSGIFTAGWRLGRIEERLKRYFQENISDVEKRIEEKVTQAHQPFDETLKGLRQKINDVELSSERRFLLKDDFNDFRKEYRQDVDRIFEKLDSLPRS